MNDICKLAGRFRHRELKNKVDFKTISAYLQKIGFAVVLYDCNKDNDLLIKYDLVEYSNTVKGFTVYRKDFKAVFIDDNTACNEKLCVLLHETAHIILNHIEQKDVQDARHLEMEADCFAYQVLHPQKDIQLFNTLAICTTVFCLCAAVMVNKHRGDADK